MEVSQIDWPAISINLRLVVVNVEMINFKELTAYFMKATY